MPDKGTQGAMAGRPPWKVAMLHALGVLAWTGLVMPPMPPSFAQTPAPVASTADQRLTQPQLEQLLAPIALYPDSLLMQMLMASTYPLEIVQAKRWLGQGQNAALRGDALAQALLAQSWDPSVKSLVPFPDVLTMMNDQLEWSQQLGDAVLAQQEDVMNAVQALRGRAQAAGQLRSGPQQTVTVVQNTASAAPSAGAVPRPAQVITIAPTQPETVSVPVYNPEVVYGAWPYPANPPVYYPPPPAYGLGSALVTGMAFATGVAVVGSLWGWAGAGWNGGNVNVDVDRVNNINANRNQISGNTWRHDERHRQGVAYRNDEVRNRVRAENPGGALDRSQTRDQSREQFRGRTENARSGGGLDAGDRRGAGGAGGGANFGDRRAAGGAGGGANVADRRQAGGPGGGANVADRRSGAGADRRAGGGDATRASVGHRADGRPQVGGQPARQGPQGLQGVGGDGARERAAANRGAASRQGQPAARERAQQRAAPQGGGGARMAAAQHGGGGGGRAAAGQRGGGGGGARAGGGGGRGGGRGR